MTTCHKIIIGDSRWMREVGDESVHLIITSPPYWQLKDYGDTGQIGFNDSYQEYINNLNLVWSECHRVLHKGCRLCINIGDQFARSVYYGRYKIIPIRTEIIKFCEVTGFDYMGAIIWQKVTTCNTSGGATIMGSYPYPRNGIVKLDYEFILLFKKWGDPPRVAREIKEASKLSKEEWNEYFYGHWNFPGERQNQHLAAFPEELPKRLIRMFSFVGETVLDPFLGGGTTSLAAMNLGRNSIGYEINPDFLLLIEKKLGIHKQELFEATATFEVVRQPGPRPDLKEAISKLPYVFQDPVKFDKRVDPRRLRFGSRIDGREKPSADLHSVKRVLSADLVELDSGEKVRLIGVKPIEAKRAEAVRFIQDLTKGQRLFLRFDEMKSDGKGELPAYLFLKNKTFINLHLIKKGYAEVDTGGEYKAKAKFLKYLNSNERRLGP